MRYIEYLDIKSFRGLKDVKLEDTGEINILVGKNNSGKTSVLEAIKLLEYPTEVGNYVHLSRVREAKSFNSLTPYESFINLFNKKSDSKSISLKTRIKDKDIELLIKGHQEKILKTFNNGDFDEFRGIVFEVQEPMPTEEEILCFKCSYTLNINESNYWGNFEITEQDKSFPIKEEQTLSILKITYVSPIDHYMLNNSLRTLNNAIKAGYKSHIIEMLRIFDEDILGIELLEENKRITPYLEHKQLGVMPLSTFGNGLKKALTLASSIVSTKGGVLLIDEIETAIRTKALGDFFDRFLQACDKYMVQVFITSHSIESIDAIIEGSKDYLNKIVGYRLENIKDKTYVSRFEGKKLYDIRYKLGLDVR